MLDREAGRIIAFERIVQQRDTSQHGRLNWWKRNLRTIRDGLRDLRGPVARPGASLRE